MHFNFLRKVRQVLLKFLSLEFQDTLSNFSFVLTLLNAYYSIDAMHVSDIYAQVQGNLLV